QVWLGSQHLSSLQSQLDSLTTLWDRFSHAVVVTDNRRQIRFANRAAERLFETGGMIVSRNGALHGGSPAIDARLNLAFGSLNNQHRHMIRLTTKGPHPPAGLTATLFRLDSDQLVMIVTNPDEPDQDFRTMLQQCYQMTATEADLVQTIVQGQSLRDYSGEHEVTYETARTHLKSAMKKNGWRRQGEMISDVLHTLLPAGAYGSVPGERS
nr:helix-turn-helix transcriptional regulator [Gammaproteobacteria bacterium]